MANFEKGDMVRLKSGGPMMTVTQTGDSTLHKNHVWTVWFDGKKKFDDTFPAESLEKIERRSGPVERD